MRKIITLILVFLFSSCSVKQPLTDTQRYTQMRSTLSKIPMVYPLKDAVDDKHFVNAAVPPYTNNASTLKSFTNKIAKGISAELIVVTYTDEGDPILTIVQYNGTAYLAIRDTTRDKNGVKVIEEFKYKTWQMFTMDNRNHYYLFNRSVTYDEYMKSLLSSHSEDQIDHLSVCFE